ncbi:MAG: YoaK family protein [Burkholderiaceae bacterium]
MPIVRRWTAVHRTPATNARLGATLAFVAGAANAGGFLAVGQYTSHMTGIVSASADHLALAQWWPALAGLAALAVFMAGAMSTAILVHWARGLRLRSQYSLPLLIEAGFLLLFGLLGAQLALHVALLLPATVLVLCYIMGLQNALITKVSKAEIRTTHVTGLVTDIGIELGKLVYVNRFRDGERVVANRRKLRLLSLLLATFFAGGVTGALGFKYIGYGTTIGLAAVLLTISLRPLLDDLRIVYRQLRRRGVEEV